MKILILGCGALGSNLTRLLASDLRKHELTVLDFDKIEERNVRANTQFYYREQIGRLKTEALQYNIFKTTGRKIEVINSKIKELHDTDLRKFNLVIDCFDNYEARKTIQDNWFVHSKLVDIEHWNLLHCGFSDRYTFTIEWAEQYQVPTDSITGFDICEMSGASSFVNSVASVTGLVVQEFIENNKKIEITGGKFTHTMM